MNITKPASWDAPKSYKKAILRLSPKVCSTLLYDNCLSQQSLSILMLKRAHRVFVETKFVLLQKYYEKPDTEKKLLQQYCCVSN